MSDMKWYAIMVVGIALAIAILYGVESRRDTTAMEQGCSQVVEQGIVLWKCDKCTTKE